jgi:polar amino acid transport system permease protein
VDYVFQFGSVWRELDQLLLGAWLTIKLSAGAMVLGLMVGIACAEAKNSRFPMLRAVVQAYVEAIRNTPFLVQLLLIYLGLPTIGIRLLPSEAALLAMVVNVGAYATEIVRAGIESVPRQQIEAGRALGLNSWQIFRFVVLMPAMRAVFPVAHAGQQRHLCIERALLEPGQHRMIHIQPIVGACDHLIILPAGLQVILVQRFKCFHGGLHKSSYSFRPSPDAPLPDRSAFLLISAANPAFHVLPCTAPTA